MKEGRQDEGEKMNVHPWHFWTNSYLFVLYLCYSSPFSTTPAMQGGFRWIDLVRL